MKTKGRNCGSCFILRVPPLAISRSTNCPKKSSPNNSVRQILSTQCQFSSYAGPAHTLAEKPESNDQISHETAKQRGAATTNATTSRSSFLAAQSLADSIDAALFDSMPDPTSLSLGSYSCYYSNMWNVVRACGPTSASFRESYPGRPQNGRNTDLSASVCVESRPRARRSKDCTVALKHQRFASPRIVRAVRGQLPDYQASDKIRQKRATLQRGGQQSRNLRRRTALNSYGSEVDRIYGVSRFQRKFCFNLLLDSVRPTERQSKPNAEDKRETVPARKEPRRSRRIIGAPTRNLMRKFDHVSKTTENGSGLKGNAAVC